ncbi:MAG: hypothetical protein QOG21_1124 [Actinomycetota bacterium]|nr:hypothetical protein [Actinomycetota bacterium]
MGPSISNGQRRTELIPLMRGMLWLGALLVTLAGIQLYFFSARTDHLFAWTIDVPLTAAFLGAFYWTSLFLAVQSAIQERWAMARVGLVGVQVFLWLTLFATLLHLDKFHLSAGNHFARGAAWLWLFIYIVDPPLLTYAYVRQIRSDLPDPPRQHATPRWFRVCLSLQAVVTIGVGAALFIAPAHTSSVWPWVLTPLTARAVASWLLGLGFVLVWAVREHDWIRLRPATISYIVLCILELIALARYRSSLESGPGTWIYIAFVISVGLLGLYGVVAAGRKKMSPEP